MAVIEQERVVVETPIVTTRDVLHRAADLLEEFGWCTRKAARDKDGKQTSCFSSGAVEFCLAGAVTRAADDLGFNRGGLVSREFLDKQKYPDHDLASQLLGNHQTWEFNDAPGRTKSEVVAKLREAAETS